MIRNKKLIEELSKFPPDARVSASYLCVEIRPPRPRKNFSSGFIFTDGWRKTAMGDFTPDPPTVSGDAILLHLLNNPEAARRIAITAIAGIYLDRCQEDVLPEDECEPPSAAGYISNIAAAVENSGVLDVIKRLREKQQS